MERPVPHIVALAPEHVLPASQALVEAFSTEPFKRVFFSRAAPRRWAATLVGRLLRAHLVAGKPGYIALVGSEVIGVVVIKPRQKSRWARAYWQVSLLGVRPPWRSQGVGRSLMGRVHDLCDRDPDARGVKLSTHGSRNRSFYEGLGYKVVGQIRLGRLGLYRMARPRG
jgi:GNAT superfamily N-acetyltransferase